MVSNTTSAHRSSRTGLDLSGRAPRIIFYCIATLVALLAVLRMIPGFSGLKIDRTTLEFLTIAVVAVILPNIKRLVLGKDGVEFEQFAAKLQDKLDEVQSSNEIIQSAIELGTGGKTAPSALPEAREKSSSESIEKLLAEMNEMIAKSPFPPQEDPTRSRRDWIVRTDSSEPSILESMRSRGRAHGHQQWSFEGAGTSSGSEPGPALEDGSWTSGRVGTAPDPELPSRSSNSSASDESLPASTPAEPGAAGQVTPPASARETTTPHSSEPAMPAAAPTPQPSADAKPAPTVLHPDDPRKGLWGGSSIDTATGRRLSATVTPAPGSSTLFKVTLMVEAIDPVSKPLTGIVNFHLHPTFRRADVPVEARESRATLVLTAWGAFTVGADADDGRTRLELDLAMLPGAPALFVAR